MTKLALQGKVETGEKQIAGLMEDKDGLIAEKQALLEDRDRTREQFDKLKKQYDEETRRLAHDLDQANKKLARVKGELDKKIADLERDLRGATAAMRLAAEEGEKDKKALKTKLADAENGLADAKKALTKRDKDYRLGLNEKQDELDGVRGKLAQLKGQIHGVIGLKGKMQNVAFVFDTSESLSRFGRDTSDEGKRKAKIRFGEYKSLLKSWIAALPFDRFSVIQFDHYAHEIPDWEGQLVEETEENRSIAIQFVAKLEPKNSTNTMDALATALALPNIDTIVLFSDGEPNNENNRPIQPGDRKAAQEACDWVRAELRKRNGTLAGSSKVTVNTIAMGEYLDAIYGKFLQDLATENGGVFIGR